VDLTNNEYCQAFLCSQFPDTTAKVWKIIKYCKTKNNEIVEVYKHTTKGVATLSVNHKTIKMISLKTLEEHEYDEIAEDDRIIFPPQVHQKSIEEKMSNMSAKQYLLSAFTGTKNRDWELISKYKNHFKEMVYEFTHDNVGRFIVTDKKDSILLTKASHTEKLNAMVSENQNFVIGLMAASKDASVTDGHFLQITSVTCWTENKHLDDSLEYTVKKMFPAELDVFDVDDTGVLTISWTESKEKLLKQLIEIGFQIKPAFLKFCDKNSNYPINKEWIEYLKNKNV
jgi:hypothetical protein